MWIMYFEDMSEAVMKEVKELGCSSSQHILIPWTLTSTLDFTGPECISSVCLMRAPNSE